MRCVMTVRWTSVRMLWSIVVLLVIAAVASGCGAPGTDDSYPSGGPSNDLSASPEVMESHTFEGSGDEETETVALSGSYLVTWEVANNITSTGDDEGFVVILRGADSGLVAELSQDAPRVLSEGSGELTVPDLPFGEYFLIVSSGEDSQWSVTFARV